jgi:hypothetical protein
MTDYETKSLELLTSIDSRIAGIQKAISSISVTEEPAAKRDPSKDMATRSEILDKASNILLVLNGGAAIALATLLKEMWGIWDISSLNTLNWAFPWLILGAFLTAVTQVMRYLNNIYWGGGVGRWVIVILYALSACCFLAGMRLAWLAAQGELVLGS